MTSLLFLPEQIEQWPIARLKPYERNPRPHSDGQVAKVAASIASYGWTVPLLVTEDGEVTPSGGPASGPQRSPGHPAVAPQSRAGAGVSRSWFSLAPGMRSSSPRNCTH